MEILKFDTGKRTNFVNEPTLGTPIALGTVSPNVTTNQSLKRKLIAAVYCSSINETRSGCCSSDANPS
ncbi:MAG: hypothetical protein GQ564_04615 [Bacteroidales bacterium]|nr:hypothetical protein [Bacteroidales bacterium]